MKDVIHIAGILLAIVFLVLLTIPIYVVPDYRKKVGNFRYLLEGLLLLAVLIAAIYIATPK